MKVYSIRQILDKYNVSDFAFVHMPGGHAPMMDFVDNPYLGELLNRIFRVSSRDCKYSSF